MHVSHAEDRPLVRETPERALSRPDTERRSGSDRIASIARARAGDPTADGNFPPSRMLSPSTSGYKIDYFRSASSIVSGK